MRTAREGHQLSIKIARMNGPDHLGNRWQVHGQFAEQDTSCWPGWLSRRLVVCFRFFFRCSDPMLWESRRAKQSTWHPDGCQVTPLRQAAAVTVGSITIGTQALITLVSVRGQDDMASVMAGEKNRLCSVLYTTSARTKLKWHKCIPYP